MRAFACTRCNGMTLVRVIAFLAVTAVLIGYEQWTVKSVEREMESGDIEPAPALA
jgi:hypothetical protein